MAALSGCNNQQPTQTGPRWTGLPFLISFPPPTTKQSGFRLCALWNEVQWSIVLKISQKVSNLSSVAPVCLLNFLTLLSARKTNGCPLWNSLKQFDWKYCGYLILLERVVKYINTLKHVLWFMGFLENCFFSYKIPVSLFFKLSNRSFWALR